MTASSSLQISLLGGFEVRIASNACLEIPTKKAKCLLAYLAFHPGEQQPREKLLGLFWGESEEKRAQHNLRQSLTYLRKSLEPLDPSPLSSDRTSVRLEPDSLEVDVDRFLQLAASSAPEDLEEAIGLYKGDLLAGLDLEEPEFQAWLETERRHLREVYCRAMQSLVESKRQSGDLNEAVRLTQNLLALDPLQERVHRLLMVIYGDMGMREAALQQFERCRTLLADDLGVEPEPETLALFESLRSGGNGKQPEFGQPQSPLTAATEEDHSKALPSSGVGNLWRRWSVAVAVVGVVIVVGLLALFRPWAPEFEPASIDRMAFPLPDVPSIAVLPFDNLSGDPEEDYFAHGVTDDLISDLSKLPDLFVIYGMSTLVYRGKEVPIRQVAEDLGVRHVLTGGVGRDGDEVRVNAQLIDAISGDRLWSERYDGALANIPAVQGQVTRQVARSLELEIAWTQDGQSTLQETASAEAYDSVLRALEHHRRFTKEDLAIALSYLQKAVRVDPDYARAHTLLGEVFWSIANEDWDRSFGLTHEETLEKARHHLRLGTKVPSIRGHFIQSQVHSNEGRYEEAITEAKKILALSANNAAGLLALGRALNKAGRAPEAIVPLRKALRVNPRGDDMGWVSYRLGESHYLSGQYRDAAKAFARSVEKNHNEWTYFFLAASLGQLDEEEKARLALASFDRIRAEAGEDPYTVAHLEGWAFKEAKDRARIQEGLRKAGMPEGVKTGLNLALPQDVAPADVAGASTIDVERAKELFERGVKLVDVRDRADWNDGHVPGAIHLYIFHDFTEEELSVIVTKDEEVIVSGEGASEGAYGAIAAARAVSWGFKRVYYLPAGFPAWKAAGYPIRVVQH